MDGIGSTKDIFVSRVQAFADSLENSPKESLDCLFTTASLLYHHGVRLASVDIVDETTLQKLRLVVDLLKEQEESQENTSFCAQLEERNSPGRPKLIITKNQLSYLADNGFKAVDMARMFQVSVATIHRRLKDFNLQISSSFSEIDDKALDDIVRTVKLQYPSSGYRMVLGHLRARGLFIQQTRVRESMRRIDPEGTISRWLHVTERRKYNVESPNALWHIDGNHKLIRWKLVVHGGIDGFSRVIVYLKCSSNNTALTVLDNFKQAISNYGVPSRVRSDKGGENVDVSLFMLSHPARGPSRGSMLVGKSVHNQRIERLWRDMYYQLTFLFYNLFYHLESCEVLDPDNDIHIFCLHYVFIPRYNSALDNFVLAWNHHGLSSARCRSPIQLWMLGMNDVANSNLTVAKETFADTEGEYNIYGIDWDGPLPCSEWSGPDEDNGDLVEIPPVNCPLQEADLERLKTHVKPLDQSDSYGIDLYMKTLSFVCNCLSITNVP